jgi:acyl-CoA thioesterase FadM
MYYAKTYKIKWHDTDACGFVRPSRLLEYMQETANLQCRDYGMDLNDLFYQKGLGFLLSRSRIRIDAPLCAYEEIEVRTWCPPSRALSFLRNFQVLRNGSVVAEALTTWGLMDARRKALIKVASAREDLSLPRNVYFILDEFGNMPKIEKFDKMITVGRSRKIWFNMVVQSYSQLNNVYGEQVADIVKSNCGVKMFIGSNDIGTCKEFSELCGNVTVSTRSVSASTGSKEGDMNVSTQIQTRPLIYPSELQKLNNKESTGNAIIVTFGNFPLKTKYTPSYKCPLYQFGQMDLTDVRSNVFHADRVFYDITRRNQMMNANSNTNIL